MRSCGCDPYVLHITGKYPDVRFSDIIVEEDVPIEGAKIATENDNLLITIPSETFNKKTKMVIHEVIAGAFLFPSGYQAASLAYLVEVDKEIKFQKKVYVQLCHSAKLKSEDDSKRLIFVSASSTPQITEAGDPVYVFEKIEGGNFDLCDQSFQYRSYSWRWNH